MGEHREVLARWQSGAWLSAFVIYSSKPEGLKTTRRKFKHGERTFRDSSVTWMVPGPLQLHGDIPDDRLGTDECPEKSSSSCMMIFRDSPSKRAPKSPDTADFVLEAIPRRIFGLAYSLLLTVYAAGLHRHAYTLLSAEALVQSEKTFVRMDDPLNRSTVLWSGEDIHTHPS